MASSSYYRLSGGRPISDKSFDEANICTTNQKAALDAASPALDSSNPVAGQTYVRQMFNQLDPQKSITHGIDYVKAGAPIGAGAAEGEKCLDTSNHKLYTFSSGSWDAGVAVSSGERFCHADTGTDTGGDAGTHTKSDKIYNYDTATSYTEITPNEGYIAWFDDEDRSRRYNSTDWVGETSIHTHNNLASKQGGTSGEYYHLTQAQHDGINNATAVTSSNVVQTKSDRDKLPVPIKFSYQGGVPVSQTDLELYEQTGSFQRILMPAAGSIVKSTMQSGSDRTAGSLTAEPSIDGTKATGNDLDLTLDAGQANDDYAETAPDTSGLTFTAGQKLGVMVTTTADWAPTDADLEVTLYVIFDS